MSETRRTRVIALICASLAVGAAVWVLVSTADNGRPAPAQSPLTSPFAPTAEVAVTPAQLRRQFGGAESSVYWLGPRRSLVAGVGSDGAVVIRYPSKSAGSETPLSVGTYFVADSVRAVEAGGQRPGAVSAVLPDGAVVTSASEEATNAYYARPGEDVLVEVFSPEPGEAYRLASGGRLREVAP